MSLFEIDRAATQARIDAVTTGGLRAQGECARRSAEIGEQARESAARQERAKQAMDELVKRAKEKQPSPPPGAAKPATPKPATLKLGAEELRPDLPPAKPPAPQPGAPARAPFGQRGPAPAPPPGAPAGPASGQRGPGQAEQRAVGRPPSGQRGPGQTGQRIPGQAEPDGPGHRVGQAESRPGPSEADVPPPTRRTLMLGAPEDRERPAGKPRPDPPEKPTPRPRHPPAEGDDDMSGRTWLR